MGASRAADGAVAVEGSVVGAAEAARAGEALAVLAVEVLVAEVIAEDREVAGGEDAETAHRSTAARRRGTSTPQLALDLC